MFNKFSKQCWKMSAKGAQLKYFSLKHFAQCKPSAAALQHLQVRCVCVKGVSQACVYGRNCVRMYVYV